MHSITCSICKNRIFDPAGTYYIRRNYQDNYIISFFRSSFIYKKDGKLLPCDEFHYIIHTPYAICEHGGNGNGISNDVIFFKGDAVKYILEEFSLPLNTAFKIDNHSIIAPYIDKILSEKLFKQPGYEYRISSIISEMLVSLGRQYEHSRNNTHPAFSALNVARTYMLSNLDKKITLEHLAGITNYSVSHFCTLYNRFFGSSPIDDLLCARIEKAISLLEHSPLSVNEISELCGFSSVNYFSRKFKEKTDANPSAYRN
ncbi:MAG: helix-turn-helix transcriptional regulator [Clostridia bacterium]|nr:helix-turn-helix transcriptional regulator [Clostridia bacterium]